MSNLVPPAEIEGLVGARRHAVAHLGRADATETVFVLHSQECKDSGIDLSRALDRGIVRHRWAAFEDTTVTLMVAPGLELVPDDDEPDDIEYLSNPPGAVP